MADVEPLSIAAGAKLVDFARACKGAARAVVLYPVGHPAINATLGRIVELTSASAMPAPMRLTVHPDALLLDDRPLARADAAVVELAVLLHSHLIGQLVVRPGGDADAWRGFLLLLARTPESVRTDGGIARVWIAERAARWTNITRYQVGLVGYRRRYRGGRLWRCALLPA